MIGELFFQKKFNNFKLSKLWNSFQNLKSTDLNVSTLQTQVDPQQQLVTDMSGLLRQMIQLIHSPESVQDQLILIEVTTPALQSSISSV